MDNLSQLVLERAEQRARTRFGMAGSGLTLGRAAELAKFAAGALASSGVQPGARTAVIGTSSNSYLVGWLGMVLAGAAPALVNPNYPTRLINEMLAQLQPEAVLWIGAEPQATVAPAAFHLDGAGLAEGRLLAAGQAVKGTPPDPLPGLSRHRLDTAGYMHTSGTTGVPKFCEQTHEYYLRLGRFIADSMCLSAADTVLAPLPMFHINPLGYGVVGGLTGRSDVLGLQRFSARRFWPLVKQAGATVLILHAPPVEILKRATSADDAAGHRVTRVFFADAEFLETFSIPLGFSAYGSTEAGGLCHIWAWRRGDHAEVVEGMSRYGGQPRCDVEWKVDQTGEIFVRAERPGVLFSGYRRGPELDAPFDADGWFATGDLGRVDPAGNLVFIERKAESIRVKGEFVPIGYVEQRFAAVEELADVAVWRRRSELVDDEVVLYVVAESIPMSGIRAVSSRLPGFMRPSSVVRVAAMPRDSGVGKVQRRLLGTVQALEAVEL